MRNPWGAVFSIGCVLIVVSLLGASLTHSAESFRSERFISPEVCGSCHTDFFDMWFGTMHSQALNDPVFRAATKLFITEVENEGERADAEHCIACHNPIAYRSGEISGTSADYDNTNEVTKFAISCDLCHTISEIVEIHNAAFNTDPGNGPDDPGTKRGPRKDAEPLYHEAAYSDIHVSPEICGACHNATHLSYGTKLEGTYDEWYDSPYNADDPSDVVPCQDCHMRQTKGNPATGMTERPDYPGRSTPMGKERPHIYRHNISGANAYIPQILGFPERAERAVERLQHAAIMEIIETGEKSGGQWGFTVRVRNEGAGHQLPTGVSEFRQMWIELTVTDSDGAVVYTSGVLNDDGSLPAETRLFQTVFGDSAGNPTLNVARAAVMLSDHRIPPKGFLDEQFRMPRKPSSPVTIRVILNYRSFDPAIAALLLGDDALPVPVIIMTAVEVTVP